jgi:hypothetical protein
MAVFSKLNKLQGQIDSQQYVLLLTPLYMHWLDLFFIDILLIHSFRIDLRPLQMQEIEVVEIVSMPQ